MCLPSAATIVNAIPTAKSGAKWEHYSEALRLRIHSAARRLSFVEQCQDPDVCFALLWFSFNAAYSKRPNSTFITERVLLDHQCVYQSFLNHHSCILSLANWQEHSKASKQTTSVPLFNKDTPAVLGSISCRLFTRDSTSRNNNANRNQLRDAIAVFGILLSASIEIMMNNKDAHWVSF